MYVLGGLRVSKFIIYSMRSFSQVALQRAFLNMTLSAEWGVNTDLTFDSFTDNGILKATVLTMGVFLGFMAVIIITICCRTRKTKQGKINHIDITFLSAIFCIFYSILLEHVLYSGFLNVKMCHT